MKLVVGVWWPLVAKGCNCSGVQVQVTSCRGQQSTDIPESPSSVMQSTGPKSILTSFVLTLWRAWKVIWKQFILFFESLILQQWSPVTPFRCDGNKPVTGTSLTCWISVIYRPQKSVPTAASGVFLLATLCQVDMLISRPIFRLCRHGDLSAPCTGGVEFSSFNPIDWFDLVSEETLETLQRKRHRLTFGPHTVERRLPNLALVSQIFKLSSVFTPQSQLGLLLRWRLMARPNINTQLQIIFTFTLLLVNFLSAPSDMIWSRGPTSITAKINADVCELRHSKGGEVKSFLKRMKQNILNKTKTTSSQHENRRFCSSNTKSQPQNWVCSSASFWLY